MTEFESYVRATLGSLTLAVGKLSDNVGDIHAKVIHQDIKVRELDGRVTALETKKPSGAPPRVSPPPPSKMADWWREDSRVFRVPEGEMDLLVKDLQRRESAGKWDATVRFLGRVGVPVLATALIAAIGYVLAHR